MSSKKAIFTWLQTLFFRRFKHFFVSKMRCDIERFGKLKLEFLKTVFPYTYGIPSDDTLRRFFRKLDPLLIG